MNKIKRYISKFLLIRKNKTKLTVTDKDSKFASDISELIGFKIQNIGLYREAFSLKSTAKKAYHCRNYERLEFLGDAVLGSIISYYLFKNYPHRNEGYLTQMKSKIVSRKNLNRLGDELQLTKYIQSTHIRVLGENIAGNLLEALIGAIYLDANYKMCEKVVDKWLLNSEEINRLENKIVSYKSILLEWSQKKRVKIEYHTTKEELPAKGQTTFRCCILLDENKLLSASESSKKKAEEKAAQRAFYTLNKKENILEK